MTELQRISSRDNALLVKLRKLAHDPGAYRKLGQIWIEGEHLCDALRQRGSKPIQAVLTESAWDEKALRELAQWAPKVSLVADNLFKSISGLESPARIGFVLEHPHDTAI
jgi:RNA methyltransferase, TrmH family